MTLTKENPFRVILYTFAIIGYISTVTKAYEESQEMYIALLVASVLVTLAVIFSFGSIMSATSGHQPGRPAQRPLWR
ncbi:hypothetical protein LP421_06220 [Rhizobium sp. RCAM05350]|nr:hypothetical protein LP421_06220 [Rhizobium sp. RCAM05350]